MRKRVVDHSMTYQWIEKEKKSRQLSFWFVIRIRNLGTRVLSSSLGVAIRSFFSSLGHWQRKKKIKAGCLPSHHLVEPYFSGHKNQQIPWLRSEKELFCGPKPAVSRSRNPLLPSISTNTFPLTRTRLKEAILSQKILENSPGKCPSLKWNSVCGAGADTRLAAPLAWTVTTAPRTALAQQYIHTHVIRSKWDGIN